MSLLVMMQNQHGLVFCGDAKSSFRDSLGTMYEEKDRVTQKVFQGKNIIVGTFGRNKFFKYYDTAVTVESEIAAILDKSPEIQPQEFLDVIRPIWSEAFKKDTSLVYNFIVGFRCGGSFATEHCKLSAAGWDITHYWEPEIRYFGTFQAVPKDVRVNGNWNVQELKDAAELIMNYAVDIGDRFYAYNPLSRPIKTVFLA